MTDETYTFISDVKEKKSVARSGGKKGKSRRGCTLPSDNLTTKEKRQMNGDMVSMSMDRPMSYAKFQSLSAEVQKDYLQNIIDCHGGNTSRIASMFGVEESQVKKLRQRLNIESRYGFGALADNEGLWLEFLAAGDFLRKPMTWKMFKTLDRFDQQDYLDFLYKECAATTRSIAQMFAVGNSTLHSYAKSHNLTLLSNKAGRQPDSNVFKWNMFIEKFGEQKEEASMESDKEQLETPPQDIKAVLENVDIPAIEDLSMTITVKSFDDIEKVLATIPKVTRGNISFIFGY